MLKNVKIEHFKSIADVSVRLSNVSVLVGSNSTGKSNFIDAVAFLRDCISHGLDEAVSERHGIDSIIQWSPTRPYNLVVSTQYENELGQGSYRIKLASKGRQPAILEEFSYWKDRPTPTDKEPRAVGFHREKEKVSFFNLSDRSNKDIERFVVKRIEDDFVLSRLKMFPVVESRAFMRLHRAVTSFQDYNIYPNTIRNPQRSSKDGELSSSGDNLNSVLRQMVGSKSVVIRSRYHEIISSMTRLIPDLQRVIIKNVSGLLWPIFEVKEGEKRGHQFNVSQISDGALRVLGILTALYQPRPPRIIAIEEPEQNIHPGALSLLAEAFKDIGNRTQIITTTHSPHMLDYFDVDNLFATEYVDNKTLIAKISAEQKKAISSRLLSASEVMTSQGFELES